MRDTTPEFQAFVDEQYLRLTPGERVRLCTEMFDAARSLVESSLPRDLSGVERKRRLGQLVAVCDVYVWKLLRHDAGLSRRQTELALVELLNPMTEES